jgi:hypothetical protein
MFYNNIVQELSTTGCKHVKWLQLKSLVGVMEIEHSLMYAVVPSGSQRIPSIWHPWDWTSAGLSIIPDYKTVSVMTNFHAGFFFFS